MIKADMNEPENWWPRQSHLRRQIASKYTKGVTGFLEHELESLPVLEDAIRVHAPEQIVEFGTGVGGLTLFLHELDKDRPLYTFDKKVMWNPHPKIKRYVGVVLGRGCKEAMKELHDTAFNECVVFDSDCDLLIKEQEHVVERLKIKKRTFLYCDNGKKYREFTMYAKYLKSGDMLGVHDWKSEISFDMEGVAELMLQFKPHPFNAFFIKNRLRTRLFIKE